MKILLMTAHPDDADIMAGGTVARWLDEGHEVCSAIFTHGEKGHDDPSMTPERVSAMREAEQRAAAAVLGGPRLIFFDFVDGELSWAGPALAEAATRLMREERPEVIVTHDPFGGAPGYREPQLHPDHRAVGTAVVDACYFRAPGPLYYPAQGASGLAPHRVREVLLIMSDHADHVVDISSTLDRKVRAVREHASQFGRHPDLEGFLRGMATRAGQRFGVPLAESFKRLTLS
ncbi:MAG TPA: PIG-L deacetylase family protein [Methylomirabilota bacterium]|jgi:LmbE family N-acetylglucosaminyl deacetylase|nr:PIG-L deacetylase family protein [Methylomirabilota bacterium]